MAVIRRSKTGGFGLVEALVAVALASVALLLGMSLLAQVAPTIERLLTHRFKLEQADEAYRLFDTQTTGKGVFVF